jgi:hypothetical protein
LTRERKARSTSARVICLPLTTAQASGEGGAESFLQAAANAQRAIAAKKRIRRFTENSF